MHRSSRNAFSALLASASICLTVTGCGVNGKTTATSVAPGSLASTPLTGSNYGGQQPISGATIQLYGVGSSGYGSASASILGGQVITTNANGGFTIPSYTCPSSATETYLTATGGISATGSTNNPNIVNMVALGPCGSLASNPHIQVNELTTVAAVYALSGFMTGVTNVGSSTGNVLGLTNAFTGANKLASVATGISPGPALPAGATIPTSEINTLADILASCVNTGGSHTEGDGSTCGTLFANAPNASGVYPTDTATAALNIAQNPGHNVATLDTLANSGSPFQPILGTAPNDWTIAITYTANSGLASPIGIVADQSGNIWVANASKNIVELDPTGAVLSGTTGYASGLVGASGALAIDPGGNAWSSSSTSGSILKVASGGTTTSYTGGGLTTINAISIDGTGEVWATGPSNVLSGFSNSGTPLAASGFSGGGISNGQSLAITPK